MGFFSREADPPPSPYIKTSIEDVELLEENKVEDGKQKKDERDVDLKLSLRMKIIMSSFGFAFFLNFLFSALVLSKINNQPTSQQSNTGSKFSGYIADVDECKINNGGCHRNATCINVIGSRVCICNEGYEGDGVGCKDIDECLERNGGCHSNAVCLNKDGSHVCVCKPGRFGDGLHCSDGGPLYLVNYRNCLDLCNEKGGRCEFCGDNGYCCRKGWDDCPIGYANASLAERHTCVILLKQVSQ